MPKSKIDLLRMVNLVILPSTSIPNSPESAHGLLNRFLQAFKDGKLFTMKSPIIKVERKHYPELNRKTFGDDFSNLKNLLIYSKSIIPE